MQSAQTLASSTVRAGQVGVSSTALCASNRRTAAFVFGVTLASAISAIVWWPNSQ